MEMLRGVAVLGIVAAADVTALPAQAQVNPRVAHLQAFLAAARIAVFRLDGIEMRAGMGHGKASLTAHL
jgi:hypothetical protein